MRQLKHLCQDDKTALDAIDRATVGEHGGDRKSGQIKNNNITLEETPKSQTGTSNTYALRKLRKDRPDLHERVLSEEISPHAAMVEACCVRTSRIGPDSAGACNTQPCMKRAVEKTYYRLFTQAHKIRVLRVGDRGQRLYDATCPLLMTPA